jgi:hypothetical protein
MPPGKDNGCEGSRCYTQDFMTNSWYEYGVLEGAQRLLRLYDEFGIKTSSFIVALAAINTPDNIKALVNSGHEVVCHGLSKPISYLYLHNDCSANFCYYIRCLPCQRGRC